MVEQVDARDQTVKAARIGDDGHPAAVEHAAQRRDVRRLAAASAACVVIALATGSPKRAASSLHAQQQVRFVDHADEPAVVEHRQLRHVGQPHALEGGEQRVVRADADHAAILGAPRDQVAQVAVAALLEQALVDHPGVVVHLGEVLVPESQTKRDHAFGLGLLAAIAQRRGQQRAGGRAAQHALGLEQFARRGEALVVGNRVGMRDRPTSRRSAERNPRRCPRPPTSRPGHACRCARGRAGSSRPDRPARSSSCGCTR